MNEKQIKTWVAIALVLNAQLPKTAKMETLIVDMMFDVKRCLDVSQRNIKRVSEILLSDTEFKRNYKSVYTGGVVIELMIKLVPNFLDEIRYYIGEDFQALVDSSVEDSYYLSDIPTPKIDNVVESLNDSVDYESGLVCIVENLDFYDFAEPLANKVSTITFVDSVLTLHRGMDEIPF